MVKYALLGLVKAKSGKEAQVEAFLKSALPLAQAESGTVSWFAVKFGDGRFGIFDTFNDEAGRDAHLNGKIAAALIANAKELLASDPDIQKIEILAAKG